jgi:hypothetical protein
VVYTARGSGEAVVSYAPAGVLVADTVTQVVQLPWSIRVERFPREKLAELYVETGDDQPAVSCQIQSGDMSTEEWTDPERKVYATGCHLELQ